MVHYKLFFLVTDTLLQSEFSENSKVYNQDKFSESMRVQQFNIIFASGGNKYCCLVFAQNIYRIHRILKGVLLLLG